MRTCGFKKTRSILKSVLRLTISRDLHSVQAMPKDKILINNLLITAKAGKDTWNRIVRQPYEVSATIYTDFSKAMMTDNLQYSLSYSTIAENILTYIKLNEERHFKSVGHLGNAICEVVLDKSIGGGEHASVSIEDQKLEIRALSIEYRFERGKSIGAPVQRDQINIRKFRTLTVIGIFDFERKSKQYVDIDLSLHLKQGQTLEVHDLVEGLAKYVELSHFQTVESLVYHIAQVVRQGSHQIFQVDVKAVKPNAIAMTDSVGVSTTIREGDVSENARCQTVENHDVQQVDRLPKVELSSQPLEEDFHTAYIAFGTNQGDCLQNISKAIDLLRQYQLKVLSTSSLYISKPMYFNDQPHFYNGILKICFQKLAPRELLAILKKIEYDHLKRMKEFDNGPRSIDLDIVLYDDKVIETEGLVIPHKSLLERDFVLQPLCELVNSDVLHPCTGERLHVHLSELKKSKVDNKDLQGLSRIVPMPRLEERKNPLIYDAFNHKTRTCIMGILNITPDSFSDGKENFDDVAAILKTAKTLVEQGSSILDIGGVSTRPHSYPPTVEEETRRVVNVVKAIRLSSDPQLAQVIISIDTYRSQVAEHCLQAGADIINDISMGQYDEAIFDVVAKYGCPYIVNHVRGTPANMNTFNTYNANQDPSLTEYMTPARADQKAYLKDPKEKDLIYGISRELAILIFKAFDHGVKKWQIILDPGIGFSKNIHQNLSIIRNASFFKLYALQKNDLPNSEYNYLSFATFPMLIGTSRKGFLGKICNEPVPSERKLSSSASLVACVQQDIDIARVHDVEESSKALAVADALYKDLV